MAVAEESGTPSSYGTIANDPSALRTLMTRLGSPEVEVRVAYEAGPTGYALCRQLSSMRIECMVVAPWLVPKQAGNRVKTDRRDALKLARLLGSGDLTPVWVPDQAHEALRNLVRARADAKADQLRAKHRLSKFLLRQGCWPPTGMKNWSQRSSTLENFYVVPTHAPSAKDTSVTAPCHAATAWLTREYQGDHRRNVRTPASTCAVHPDHTSPPLDNTFHIRCSADC